jgi:RNA polymerase sigma-70 factor, ECF subfamily
LPQVSLRKSDATPAPGGDRNSPRALDDLAVMGLVQGGDREALSLLFDRYSRLVLNVATRILRDRMEGQDLLQDVFLYIHRRNSIFDPSKGTVASWIIQVTYSRAFNRRERLSARAQADCVRIDELADSVSSEIRIDKLTDELSARKLVQQALTELTERQRETLRMYFFEGYSLREISVNLQETLTNTRHHYYRGIERLKGVLKSSLAREKNENEGVA